MKEKIATFLEQKYLLYTPIAIIIFFTLVKIFYFINYPSLNFDETVVLNISRQPWSIFIKSVSSEPHPIFFYLLLRLFRNFDFVTLKIILSTISMLLVILTVIFVNKYHMWERYQIRLGAYLLLVSNVFFITTSQIKQDIFTVPLLFLFINLYFIYKENNKYQYLSYLTVLSVIIMLFGLRPFLSAMTVWIYEIIIVIKNWGWSDRVKIILVRISVIILIFALYFSVFGYQQFINNRNRMSWMNLYANNFSYVLADNFLPLSIPIINNNELISLLLFIFVIITLRDIRHNRINSIEKIIVCLILINWLMGYFIGSFVRVRYSAFLLILIHLIISRYLNKLKPNITVLIVLFYIVVTFIVSGIDFMNIHKEDLRRHKELLDISKRNRDESYIWLMDWVGTPPVCLSKYNEIDNVVAVGMGATNVETRYIDYDVLQLSNNDSISYWNKIGRKNLFNNIDELFIEGNQNVFYTMGNNFYFEYIRKDLLEFLNTRCEITDISSNEIGEIVIIYKKCSYYQQ